MAQPHALFHRLIRRSGPALAALLAVSVHAGDTERTVGFRPLEIYSFKSGTGLLTVEDLNGDGLDDILFSNNHVSRLEILLRKPGATLTGDLPELEECFDDRGMIVDQRIGVLRVADLNGDERKDLITFGTAIGLLVRHQLEDGSFDEPARVFVKQRSSVTDIKTGDLNGDGRVDLLVTHRDHAEIYWNDPDRPFMEQKNLTFSDDKCYTGYIADINEDGLADLAFAFNTAGNPLMVRYGSGNSVFGIEQPIDLPPRQYMDLADREGAPPQIALVLQNRLAFRSYRFEERAQPQLMETLECTPRRIGLEGTGRKAVPAWITADIDLDGYDDLLVAAPELSRLHLYAGRAEGLNPEPTRIDTLSEVDRISRMADGSLLVVSKKEKIAALHASEDLTRFPGILETPGDVLAGCAVESGNSAWLICKNEEKELKLVQVWLDGSEGSVHALDLRNDPADLMAFTLPDRRTGILLFMPYDTPKMMIIDGTEMTELTSESFRALAQQLERANIRCETPGDGRVLMVSQGAIARRFEWNTDRYDAVRQFNPENPRGELIASTGLALHDRTKGTLLYDRNSSDLIIFDEDGEDTGRIHLSDADPTIFGMTQLKNPERDVIILIDRSGLNEVMGNGNRLEAAVSAEYLSPTENPLLAYAKPVTLGNPPQPMIALVDTANRSIELVRQTEDTLESELVFEVFLISDFADAATARGIEPHDLESGDLNGDGIGDLVLLSQDKLLIYPGE